MMSPIIVDLPHPDGAEIIINFPFFIGRKYLRDFLKILLIEMFAAKAEIYMALSTCSLICSSSSFIFTTRICISA